MKRVVVALVVCALVAAFAPRAARGEDEWLGRDKALHFGASALIAGAAYGAAALFSERTAPRVWTGIAVSAAAGIGKELYDLGGRGTPSGKDLVWDAAGIAVGVVVAWAIDRWLFEDSPDKSSQGALPSPLYGWSF